LKTNVYVDGFNLYYGCLRGTPYKWLDIRKLCETEFPSNTINRIRYFTANVIARPTDPQQPTRQQAYLRALRTIPNLTIHKGEFLSNAVRMPLVNSPAGGPNTVEVWKTEEKGSDVNLATFLLLDAFDNDCDADIVVSNDSDLAEPIFQVKRRLKVKVVILHPLRERTPGVTPHPNYKLVKAATKSVTVKEASLMASQFPPILTDSYGTITKPTGW
jgi:hypothetical protein